jgi:hypothetical protein
MAGKIREAVSKAVTKSAAGMGAGKMRKVMLSAAAIAALSLMGYEVVGGMVKRRALTEGKSASAAHQEYKAVGGKSAVVAGTALAALLAARAYKNRSKKRKEPFDWKNPPKPKPK